MCTVSSLLTVPGYSYVTEIQPHRQFSMADVDQMERKRKPKSSLRWLALLYQLPHDVAQPGPSKTHTVKSIPACKRRPRTLSCKSRAATAAEQRKSRHAELHG